MTVKELNQKYQTNLPELLLPEEIGNPKLWESQGRPRLKEILQKAEYGAFPQYDSKNTTFEVQESGKVLGMDYLQKEPAVDASRVAVVGHSRLGKTALVAGAFDERFAITISNDSGAGGAALYKTKVGEHTEYMVETIPYWFCNCFKEYYRAEEKMPYDQHFLLALAAPRPLYAASAQLDEWSDPLAEFSAASLASLVYEQVYGIAGLEAAEQPPVDAPVNSGNVAYYVRTGPHNILKYDWHTFMDFADKYFK